MNNFVLKPTIAIILQFVLVQIGFSQNQDIQIKDGVYPFAEQMPEFKGNVYKYIDSVLQYPKVAKESGVEGKVVLYFVINEDGTIDKNSITVAKNMGWGLDQEAIRIVSNMPVWKPGKQDGKNVKVRLSLPIVFKINQ